LLKAIVAGRLKPRLAQISENAAPKRSLVAWKRQTRSLVSSVEIAGAPETFISMMLAASVSGMTASDTPEAQVPRIACTLLTSISFLAASTAASGLVWSSSVNSSSLTPPAPPAALTSSTASLIACCMPGPYGLPAPVMGVSEPMRNVSPCCAKARPGRP
jgi:hypothetical protein